MLTTDGLDGRTDFFFGRNLTFFRDVRYWRLQEIAKLWKYKLAHQLFI